MTKSELAKVVADRYTKFEESLDSDKSFDDLSVKAKSEAMINIVLESITEALIEDDKVALSGFGTFEVRERVEKQCVNPQTKEKMTVPAYKAAVFKAGKNLKDAVNK